MIGIGAGKRRQAHQQTSVAIINSLRFLVSEPAANVEPVHYI